MLTTSHTLQSNRYRIVGQLGQMDTGLAYEAFDASLNKKVLLHEALIDNPISGAPRTAARDAHPAVAVNHPSLLTVKDSFQENGRQYLVMEHVEGRTLGEILERKTSAFPLKEVTLWADSLLDAIHQLHVSNPPHFHGAVRPQNIKLGVDGRVRLFVFSQEASGTAPAAGLDAAALPYLPIEQIWSGLDVASQKVIRSDYDEQSAELLDQPIDAQSDVYSVAATVYHLLTGRVPADALTRSIDLLEGKPDPLRRPNHVNAGIPAEVGEVLMRALAVRREYRFSSAAIFRQVFRSAVSKARETGHAGREYRDEETVLEIPSVPVRPEQKLRPSDAEAEQIRQLELMKRQLREAEEKRLEAERRAAEAEQRLHERVTQQFNLSEIEIPAASPAAVQPAAEPQAFEPPESAPQQVPEPVHAMETGLFEPAEEPRRPLFKVAGAAILFVFAGGAGWGIWNASQTPAPESADPVATRPAPAQPAPAAPDEGIVTSNSESKAPETVAAEPVEEVRPADQNAAVKAKPTPAQQAKKQPSPTPKSGEPQKKTVTLDDLLKDN